SLSAQMNGQAAKLTSKAGAGALCVGLFEAGLQKFSLNYLRTVLQSYGFEMGNSFRETATELVESLDRNQRVGLALSLVVELSSQGHIATSDIGAIAGLADDLEVEDPNAIADDTDPRKSDPEAIAPEVEEPTGEVETDTPKNTKSKRKRRRTAVAAGAS
ncbi:MAG: hypothetical protein AAFX40_18575, partial [Cyanobacteria bacterium J06639_1]